MPTCAYGYIAGRSLRSMSAYHATDQKRAKAPESATSPPLSWSEVETMDILADEELMKDIEEGIEDIRAGRVVEWKPRNVQNAKSA